MRAAGILALVICLLPAPALSDAGAPSGDDYRDAWSAHDDAVGERLRQRVEQVALGALTEIDGTPIANVEHLPQLYEARRFRPIWSYPERRVELLALVEESAAHGLDPADYHLPAVAEIVARGVQSAGTTTAADEDILLTDAFLRLEHHLRHGKVDPSGLYPHWNMDAEIEIADPLDGSRAVLAADSLRDGLAAAIPRGRPYRILVEALADYRRIAAAGGWRPVSDGATLKPGMSDPRIEELRGRLAAEFKIPPVGRRQWFDGGLESVVRAFQRRYGLDPDGAVGSATLAAMNVSVARRIDQIRVNLERARWVMTAPLPGYLVVNIAGFHAFLIRDDEIAWESRVVVGTPYRKTPVFQARLTYLVVNPTWTVPPVILAEDILPEMLADGRALARRGLEVFDNDGRRLAPDGIDWARYARGGFPYQLVQPPGPRNALGRVKFVMPNPYHVFLHDTPARKLFERSERTFSSGCIRIERPLALAELLLEEAADWDRTAIDRVIARGDTRTVFLPRPLPVLLLYWTAGMGPDGEFGFHDDVYGRDGPVLEALDRDFVPHRLAAAADR